MSIKYTSPVTFTPAQFGRWLAVHVDMLTASGKRIPVSTLTLRGEDGKKANDLHFAYIAKAFLSGDSGAIGDKTTMNAARIVMDTCEVAAGKGVVFEFFFPSKPDYTDSPDDFSPVLWTDGTVMQVTAQQMYETCKASDSVREICEGFAVSNPGVKVTIPVLPEKESGEKRAKSAGKVTTDLSSLFD